MSETIVIYETAIGQPLSDQIVIGTRAFDIPAGSTVTFKMRHYNSEVLKINAEADIVDNATGKVKYDWQTLDIDTPGQYMGWWVIDASGSTIETDEFPIIVATHAPGLQTRTGAIYQAAKSFLPITWERLEGSDHYGDKQLQNKVEIAKLSLLGVEIPVEDEGNLDIRVAAYIAKIAVISVIPAGKDYWAAMAVSKTATGTDESVSYPDRIAMLEQLHEQLVEEIADDRDDIAELIDLPNVRRSNSVPSVSDGTDEGFITPNPHTNFRDYGFAIRGNNHRRRNAVRGTYW